MSEMTPESELGRKIAEAKVIAVLVIDRAEDAVSLAKALLDGGIEVMELTLRTRAAIAALREVRQNVPEMIAGIGTILTTAQVDEVVAAGAHFGVSPGVNPEVIRHAQTQQLPFGPGIMTPTDIDASVALGCRLLKYFPASTAGGLKHLANIAAPFAHLGLGFIPLGGINAENMREYLDSPLITAIGGSWLAPRDLIAARDWKEITRRAAEAKFISG